jgi:hypothetical protein
VRTIVLGVHGVLCATGANDIELLVHSHRVGSPSPCHVLEDRIDRQVAKHPGFRVKERRYFVTQIKKEETESRKLLVAA